MGRVNIDQEGKGDKPVDFIARCRNGETHSYDIVEEPMANDTVWNYVNDFLSGRVFIGLTVAAEQLIVSIFSTERALKRNL